MGNGLFLPILETNCLEATLQELAAQHQLTVSGTLLQPTASVLSQHNFNPRTVLVFGNEYDGISEPVQQQLAVRLIIPMLNGTDSLNVAVSAGIFLHQYRSQHPPAL
jgi:tRNA G18 (ribose-2'-O)-methylase SpoU